MQWIVWYPTYHKGKTVSLFMPPGHIRGVEVQLHSYILDESEGSGSCLNHLTQGKEPQDTLIRRLGGTPRCSGCS
jgi:hypothetical protein